jgi:pimeloyl-ACP methyl ester carboxylesterase
MIMADTTPPPGGANTLAPSQPSPAQTQAAQTSQTFVIGGAGEGPIQPFSFHASDDDLADLKRRIKATRWPSRELVGDGSQGVQLATVQKLAEYWANQHDWRNVEARINSYPNFITPIDGVDIHFIHVRSKHRDARPIVITHGWPGSIIENLKVIEPLTDPTAYGGAAEDAFDVVIPSMPGYGFSGKPIDLGWNPERIARAWITLMNRLGYDRFFASGGDWGAPITEEIALQAPSQVIGIQTNLAFAMPPEVAKGAVAGAPPPPDLNDRERRAYDQLVYFFTKGLGYALEMGNRPQTMYGLEDSPVGLAAWIIDHDIDSYKLITRVFVDGAEEGLSRDDICDNITLYWLTGTGVSSSRLYWENKLPFYVPLGQTVPVVVSSFPDEIYAVPPSWAKQAYSNLVYFGDHTKGGHFAAWEQPQAIVDDLRKGFRSLQ